MVEDPQYVVVSLEQVPQCSCHEEIQPPAPNVLRAIVNNVAPLAECLEVFPLIMTGVVQVRRRQINPCNRRMAWLWGTGGIGALQVKVARLEIDVPGEVKFELCLFVVVEIA